MFTIDEVTIPAAVELGNAVNPIGYGFCATDMNQKPTNERSRFLNQHEPMMMLVARTDGRMVGHDSYENPIGDDTDSAWLAAQVLP